jgi:hypothetical protein
MLPAKATICPGSFARAALRARSEKCKAVFRKIVQQSKKLEHDSDSKKSDHAPPRLGPFRLWMNRATTQAACFFVLLIGITAYTFPGSTRRQFRRG